jgi:hypothetical protein
VKTEKLNKKVKFNFYKTFRIIINNYLIYALDELGSSSYQSFRQLGFWILTFTRYPASVLISAASEDGGSQKESTMVA